MGRSNVIDRLPPDVDTGGGGGGGWAWLLTANGHVEAQLIRGLLEAEGIEPVVMDASDPSPGSWLFLSGDPNALVRIYVPRARLDDARLVLLEIEGSAPDPEPAGSSSGVGWAWIAIAVTIIGLYLAAAWVNAMRTVPGTGI